MLRLHVLGVGDAFSEQYHNASLCVEEPQSGTLLLIDCPPAFPRVMADHRKKTNVDLSAHTIDHVLITHLHGDHCMGLEAYLFMRRFLVRRRPFLYGAKIVLDPLWENRLYGAMAYLAPPSQEFTQEEIDEHLRNPLHKDKKAHAVLQASRQVLLPPTQGLKLADYAERINLSEKTAIGPLVIEHYFTCHHVPTTALRISLLGANEPLLSYSADTAFDPDLIAWLAEAKTIIHETNFGIHTPLHTLMLLPPSIRSRMHLIHYPDLLDCDKSPIPCLREGMVLTLT